MQPDDLPDSADRADRADLADLRRSYGSAQLSEADVAADPMAQFARWFDDAARVRLVEPNAMVVSTASTAGLPSSRTVLLKGFDDRGFVFFTNYESRKGRELAANPQAALLFPWYPMERQVIVTGTVERVPREESVAYFAIRPRGSQIGAWASRQSEVVSSRAELEQRFATLSAEFGDDIATPEFWGGYLVRPMSVEFWQGRTDRLHDRLRYRIDDASGPRSWVLERLSP